MYIFKNAVRNITRNKGRNILIGIIIIVISAACSVTLAIRESANKIIKSYQEKNELEATISMDRRSLMNSFKNEGENKSQEDMINTFNSIKSLTLDEIKKYADSKYVKNYYYTYELSVNAKDITEATDSLVKETTETTTETETKQFKSSSSNKPGMPPDGGGYETTRRTTRTTTEKIFNEKAQEGAFKLIGYNSYESMSNFINGNYTIVDGEVINDFNSDSVVISEELATLNNLKVGDTMTIVDPKNEELTYDATITGIYKENTDSSNNMAKMFSNSANEIITNTNFIQKILDQNSELSSTITPTFILTSKDIIDKFNEEVKNKGLSEYYTVKTNVDELESATESVDNVKTFATTFLIITLIIGGVVLIVINMINIRERKYEIGVLRTIGMKRSKLSLQFMIELAIISVFGLMIGAGIGATLSVPVSNKLLQNEITNSNTKYEDIGKNFGKPGEDSNTKSSSTSTEKRDFKNMNFGVAKVNEIKSIDAVVNFKVLAELLGIGMALTILSSLASIISIARFSPLTILKERS